ncbi:MAG: FecR domain-containing protein [Candidatus Omnitrophica bacterium]|nr:FecR domain-containing protein [Candidatus Omnitrophota bacterium]
MKKFRITGISFIIVLILSAGSILWAAEIIYLEGKVEVKRKKEKDWEKATLGMKLEPGDMLWTRGIDSRVDVDLDEEDKGKNIFKLDGNTQSILRADADPSQIDSVDLDYGDLFAKIEKIEGDSTFDVYTLTAVAGVRGTDWGVSTNKEEEESDISCYKGRIYVKAFDEEGRLLAKIDVDAGYTVHVKKAQAPSEATVVPEEKKQEYEGWDEEISEYIEKEQKKAEEGGISNLIIDKVKELYEEFKNAYSQGDINGVLNCVARDWESSGGQSFYDLDDRLNNIFSTFEQFQVDMSGFSIQPSDDPEYVAKVSYYMKIEASLLSDPSIKHHEEGDVIEYIKKEGDKYLIAKTVGKGAF